MVFCLLPTSHAINYTLSDGRYLRLIDSSHWACEFWAIFAKNISANWEQMRQKTQVKPRFGKDIH